MSEPLLTRRFAGLWLFAFVAFFSAFQLLPVIPFRILQLGGTKATAGWFLGVYTYASAFAAPLMGSIADRVGRRRLLIVVAALFIIFSVLYGFVTYLPLLLCIGAIHGSLWSGLMASSSAIMSEYIPESRRMQGLAYWGLSSTLAVAIGPPVGLAVFRFGWTTLCIEMALLSVAMLIGAFFLRATLPAQSENPFRIREAWDWNVIRVALAFAVLSFGQGGATSYVAMLSQERKIEPDSLWFTVFATTIIFIRLSASHLGDRVDPRTILYPAFAAVPLSFVILALSHTTAGVIASAVLFGLALGAAFPAFMTFILGMTDLRHRARTFGSVLWAFDIGIGSGSFIVGVLGHRYGFTTAFLVASALSCLAIPIFRSARQKLIRGTAVASSIDHAGTE